MLSFEPSCQWPNQIIDPRLQKYTSRSLQFSLICKLQHFFHILETHERILSPHHFVSQSNNFSFAKQHAFMVKTLWIKRAQKIADADELTIK